MTFDIQAMNHQRRRIIRVILLLLLLWSSSGACLSWTAASSSSSSSLHNNNQHHPPRMPNDAAVCPPRGGGETPPLAAEDDEELDAYIEKLIASVDSSSEVENNHVDREEEEIDVEVDEEEEVEVDEEEESGEIDVQVGVEEGVQEEEEEPTSKEYSTVEETEIETVSSSKRKKSKGFIDDDHSSSPQSSSSSFERRERVSRPRPPNPLYRFMLRQGRIGHIMVMVMVLLVEWVETYLPPLAHFLAWIWSLLVPKAARTTSAAARKKRPPARSRLSTTSARTGRSGKQRRAMIREADQAALEQLRRAGNVRAAKYRHVSAEFLQRHCLGPYATAASTRPGVMEQQDKLVLQVAGVEEGEYDEEEAALVEEDEDDWVVKALTEDDNNREQQDLPVKPSIAFELGPRGPTASVGVEFSFGGGKKRRKSLAEAVSSRREKVKRRYRPRTSDQNGGDGVLGRIRAATGVNSIMSRSILGAYPGDAVPPSEAGSATGIIDLAQKYGYGDWSDDEDEDEVRSPHKQKKRRRRKRHERHSDEGSRSKSRRPSSSIGLDFDFSGSESLASVRASRRPDRSKRDHREPKLSSLATLNGRRRTTSSQRKEATMKRRDHAEEVTMVVPAMQRLNEVRRKRKSKKRQEDED